MYFVYGIIRFSHTNSTVFCHDPDNTAMSVPDLRDAYQFASKDEAKEFLNKKPMANFIKWIGILEKV